MKAEIKRVGPKFKGVSAELSRADLVNIEVALRSRAEACEDNGEKRKAASWRRTHRKIAFILEWKE